jgi:hypothetical protein
MLSVIMLRVIMLSVIMLNVIMLSVIMLSVILVSVIMVSVAMLNVVAPQVSLIFVCCVWMSIVCNILLLMHSGKKRSSFFCQMIKKNVSQH